MTWFWISLIILEAIAFIAKEHGDRKRTVAALMLIPADRVDVLRYKVLTKSWWTQIQDKIKTLGLILVGAILAWLLIMTAQ